jgi:phospholipid/cholesterol/gamma-HCH transport system permease protein
LARLKPREIDSVRILLDDLDRLDTAGAWLILRSARVLEQAGLKVELADVPERYAPLLDKIHVDCPAFAGFGKRKPVEVATHGYMAFAERVGRGFCHAMSQGARLLSFFGVVCQETATVIVHPSRLRLATFVTQIEQTGLNALPVLGLLTFLIGVVLAFQGASQLTHFGAEILTVNLVSIAVLRELGGMIAAIIVAGRSGSAFTAEIGSMKVNQELDAMRAIGLNVIEVLVLPRVLGLMITLPLLTIFANAMGLLGGALMCDFALGIPIPQFLEQLRGVMGGWQPWLGVIKAPVFAFLISMVGCFEGLRVENNATSVGRLTTQSVVESIFLIIVADAIFSVIFSMMDI